MSVFASLKEVVRVLNEIRQSRAAIGFKMPALEEAISLGVIFEETVRRHGDLLALEFEGRSWTYSQLNQEINRLAHLLKAQGVKQGEGVALFMENRAEFVISLLALTKIGAPAALINNSLSGEALVHCCKVTNAKHCIVGDERADVLAPELAGLPFGQGHGSCFWMKDTVDREAPGWAMDANQAMQGHSDQDLPETHGILAGDVALYIFTSGTTGLPKAATYKQQRLVAAANLLGSLTLRPKPGDRLYLCLPIYHITGLGPGLCGFIAAGGTVCLRRTFSASKFWSEVQAWQTNSFVYVGELCRYLVTQAPSDAEKNNPLQKMVGNGLRPDVWDEFKSRFDVNRICEIYGSSEGNVTFLNLLNKDRTIGTTSVDVALVKYDVNEDTIVRDDAGRCELARPGEPGLLLGKITDITPFDGYTNAEATNSKIIENVQETGDRWFNTGDLVREIDVGFAMGLKHYQFVDRTGDTFRWRAENVSTNEVGEVLNSHPQINMANVYGVEVPGTEGRAGMVAFALEAGTDFDIDGFRALVDTRLPDYARPVFVRLQQDTETTVTFKLLKGKLREQAYHLDKLGKDRMYVRHPRSGEYRVLDDEFYQKILAAEAGY